MNLNDSRSGSTAAGSNSPDSISSASSTGSPSTETPSRTLREWLFHTSILTVLRERRARRGAATDGGSSASRLNSLPAPLREIVTETVRLTRLRRRERRAITAELAAHMHDALAAGQAPAAITANFGDPAVVAPAIRRAAIAKRSGFDRSLGLLKRVALIGLVLGGSVYLLAALRIWMLSPTIEFDPIERMNALLPDAGEAPAWPLYKDGLRWQKVLQGERRHGDSRLWSTNPDEPGAMLLLEPGESPEALPNDGTSAAPSEELLASRREADVEALRSHQREIALLREAAARPALGLPLTLQPDPDDRIFAILEQGSGAVARLEAEMRRTDASAEPPYFPAFSVQLIHFVELRRAARLLAADAWLALEEGDGDRAADDFLAILGIARHAEESRTIISQLVGSALHAMASSHIRRALVERPEDLGDEALRQLAEGLAAIPESAWELDLEGERIGFEDAVQRLFSNDGSGDGVLLPHAMDELQSLVQFAGEQPGPKSQSRLADAASFLAGPAGAALIPGRRETLDGHTRLRDAIRFASTRPIGDPEGSAVINRVEQELLGSGGVGVGGPRSVLQLLAPALSRAWEVRRETQATVEAAEVAVALERFRRANDALPASLVELVPNWLDRVPRDPYDGAPLRYTLRDGSPLLWSISRDRVDDGGKPWKPKRAVGSLTGISARWFPPRSGELGDWILFDVPSE